MPFCCSWLPFGALGCLLGASWGLLGASWCLLGRSWAPLGASWGALGRLLVPLGAVLRFEVDFWTDFGANLAPQRRPKRHQNGTPNGAKSKTNFDLKKQALQDRLGAVLGRSWVIFGRPLGSFLLIFYWFLNGFVKIHFFQKISLQEPSWTELGPTWVDFGTKNGAKMAPQSDPKTIQKHVNFQSRKKTEKGLQEKPVRARTGSALSGRELLSSSEGLLSKNS